MKKHRFILVYLLLIFSLLFTSCINSTPQHPASEKGLSATFYPVGKGDCILLQCEGEAMLIDAGYSKNTDDILSYLSEQNIKSLSAIITTHPDKDHIGGIPGIISSGMDIGVLYKTDVVKNNSDDYSAMLSTIENYNIHVENPKPGSHFLLGSATVTFLAPLSNDYNDVNNTSIVVKVDYAGKSMLFTGDILNDAENDLLDTATDLSSDILKVAYHGRSASSSKKFLEMAHPKYAVITCDENNDNAPSTKVLDRLKKLNATVLRTDKDGIIIITVNPNGEITLVKDM
ncbi:ComEC/Rec2 family competence protein [Clostridium argentinense]|uniref:ComEC/Rec2 family competence protein n=1 Tax=Clostridium argentinense TaxID=29341 RepID=UPI0006906387|nr:ComEC/Rec2 family competence protein [Clostridium argentinense]ARC86015.1 MBL fold metallo-hydrolase [Clostridium argentinense]